MTHVNKHHLNRTGIFTRGTIRHLIILVIALVAAIAILPQLHTFSGSWQVIGRADKALFAWGLLLIGGSYFAAAGSYCLLAYFTLSYPKTLIIQIADGFTNRLLPVGLGGIATNILYLIRQNRSSRAGYVVGINNIIGVIGHIAVLIVLALANPSEVGDMLIALHSERWLALVAAAVLIISTAIIISRRLKRITKSSLKQITAVGRFAIRHKIRLLAALACSIAVTACYALTLLAVALALNVHLSVFEVFMILTAGLLVKTITPSPGGVGGAEAGLMAALISFGVPGGQALSIALCYHLLTFWVPIIPGIVALNVALGRRYLTRP